MPIKISTFLAGSLAGAAATAAVAWYSNRLAMFPARQMYNALEAFSEQLRHEQRVAARGTYFTIDRILDADCKGKPLVIGTCPKMLTTSPWGNQGIRHGQPGAPIRRLLEFQREDSSLYYRFEDQTMLSVTKQPNGTLLYTFQDPSVSVTKTMDPLLVKNLKGIDMNSQELDAIVQMR